MSFCHIIINIIYSIVLYVTCSTLFHIVVMAALLKLGGELHGTAVYFDLIEAEEVEIC